MRVVGEYIAYLIVRLVICVAQALPLSVCDSIARGLAWLFADVLRARRKITDENLRHAFPEWSAAKRKKTARQMWHHLFLFICEIAQTSRRIHRHNWHQHVRIVGEAKLVRMLMTGRPMLLVTAHFGNFELAGYLLSLFGYRIHTVARPLDNRFLDRFLQRFRASQGQEMLSKQSDYARIRDILADGGTVSFLADQYAGAKGCWVNFFGRPASAHKAIPLFALDNDAPIAVGCCRRLEGEPMRYELRLQEIADPRELADNEQNTRWLAQWYHDQFEAFIREAPEQYWWLHRRWKDRRKKRGTQKAQKLAA